jgi:hypothetical protein
MLVPQGRWEVNDFEKLKQELKAAFYGVSDIGHQVNCPFRIKSGIFPPPSYMAKLTLFLVGNFTNCGGSDKAEWSTFVSYEDTDFEIRDWKHSTWTIEASEDSDKARAAGQKLEKKISRVAARLDKALSKELEENISTAEFMLNNPYGKIRYAYQWFRERAKELAEAPSQDTGESTPTVLAHLLNPPNLTERVVHGYAMAGFYYSSLEFLLNVFYAFGDRNLDFLTFRKNSWQERFLAVLPVAGRPDLARIYEKLLHLKTNFRDELFHGFGGAENLLVNLPGVGLVPISYEALTRSIHFSSLSMDVSFVDEALRAFDEFDAWLRNNPPWSCYVEYAESGFEIPFYGKRLEEIKRAVEYPDDFSEWIDIEAAYRAYHSM